MLDRSKFEDDLAAGKEFEEVVEDTLNDAGMHVVIYKSSKWQRTKGEGNVVECKRDREAEKTGNYYVEIEQKTSSGWEKSGIWRDDNTYMWAQGTLQGFHLISRRTLRYFHASGDFDIAPTRHPNDVPTNGVLVPVDVFAAYAIRSWPESRGPELNPTFYGDDVPRRRARRDGDPSAIALDGESCIFWNDVDRWAEELRRKRRKANQPPRPEHWDWP